MSESKRRARCTLEFKLEAVRLVKVAAVTAKIPGIPKQTELPTVFRRQGHLPNARVRAPH